MRAKMSRMIVTAAIVASACVANVSLAAAHGGGWHGGGWHGGGWHGSVGIYVGPGWGWYGYPYYAGYPYYPYPYAYPYSYAYPYPAYAPSVSVPYIEGPAASARAVYWYYCKAPAGYYPYVRSCSTGWMKVRPQDVPGASSSERQ
jgi:hypothetical protein